MKFIKKWVLHFYSDSLYRNSFFLMLSTAIMSAIGFVYWFVAAKLYTPEQIGLTTTFISIVQLVAVFSMLGVNTSIIRFLPTSKNKTTQVNTAITVVSIASTILAVIVMMLLPILSSTLLFLRNSVWLIIGFVIFCVLVAIITLTDSFFIAYRSAHINLIVNTVTSLTKLLFLPLLVGWGTFGLTGSFVIAVIVASLLSLAFTVYKFKHELKPHINRDVVKEFYKYSIGNYLAGFIGGLPTMLLPLIITNRLGPQYTAYYYMPMMIIGLLYIIPQAVSQSLFAEGSHDEAHLGKYVSKAVRNIAIFLIPGVVGVFLFGDVVLRSFGEDYLREGHGFLMLLALSGVFVSLYYIASAHLKVAHALKVLVVVNMIISLAILLPVYILRLDNITSVGIVWVVGYCLGSIFSIFAVKLKKS